VNTHRIELLVGTLLQVLAVVWIVRSSVFKGAKLTFGSVLRALQRLWRWLRAQPKKAGQRLHDWLQRMLNRFRSRKQMTFRSEARSTGTLTAEVIRGGNPLDRLRADLDRLQADHDELKDSIHQRFNISTKDAIWSGVMAVAGAVLLLIADW
jgi:hypothetical protein